MQAAKALWDIKDPKNYPENFGDQSCAKFLDRLANDVKFKFETSAFNPSVGSRDDFFKHVCNSEDKILEAIKRVGEIIKALLDRAKLIPGLIHSNNMLWRRGELLRKMLEHYGSMSTKLEEEMRVLLQQLAYMAFQVHTLMNALNIQYNPTTGELTDNKNVKIDSTRADLLGIDNRMKDLLEILASVASGSLYGQKLMLESPPRFSLTFNATDFAAVDQAKISQEIASLLAETVTQLGGTSIPVEDLQRFVTFKQGSLVLIVQLTEDYVKTSGITEDQRKILQMAMFNIAFMTPDTSKYPTLNEMYTKEQPKLPDFEIPGLQPMAENDPVEWKTALQRDFGIDTSKFAEAKPVEAKAAPAEALAEETAAVGGMNDEDQKAFAARDSLQVTNFGENGLKIDGGQISESALKYAVLKAVQNANPTQLGALPPNILDAAIFTETPNEPRRTRSGKPYGAQMAQVHRGSAAKKRRSSARQTRNSARSSRNVTRRKSGRARNSGRQRNSSKRRNSTRRNSKRRNSTRRDRRSSTRRGGKYSGNAVIYVDWKAFGDLVSKIPGLKLSDLKAVNAQSVLNVVKAVNPKEKGLTESEKAIIQELFDNIKILETSIVDLTDPNEIPLVPLFTKKEVLNDVVAGLGDVKLTAVVTAKDKLLAQIKLLAQSNEVKEFIRVRPYNDKDIRATELQLGTIGQVFDRSPDPQVIQGQLATLVDYNGNCLGFTKLFREDKGKDMFFNKFSKFIPAGKVPPEKEWFSTVNGGVFFEPYSYADASRSDDGKGVSVVPTEMLRLRKQVSAPIKYSWFKKDKKTRTDNNDPEKGLILPITPKTETLALLKKQITPPAGGATPDLNDPYAFKKPFSDLKDAWIKDTKSRKTELQNLREASLKQLKADDPKIKSIDDALKQLPSEVNDDAFLLEYYKNRTLSEAINDEFVDTVWPVMQIYFGLPLDDGTISDDTKNIVTFFYGASGSGKTFSAEAILKKCFDEIRKHKDEFQLKIVSDYNNELYDYYSTAGNVKHRINDKVYQTIIMGKNVGEKAMRTQQFNEMSLRAEFLGWTPSSTDPSIKQPPEVFWEGNPSDEIKYIRKKTAKPTDSDLDLLGTYNPAIWTAAEYTEATKLNEAKSKNDVKINTVLTIPKDDAAFDKFKQDYDKRVVAFRSVTDTGLNPESSRSHLLYIIIRKTKNGQPMASTERGAQFILADFAGTEDLNYLMTQEAWTIWKDWAKSKNFLTEQVEGNCKLAGKDVKQDWACVELPKLANSTDSSDATTREAFRKALVNGWKTIKIKTLVAKQISEAPSLPPDMDAYKAKLTQEWSDILKKPYVTYDANATPTYLDEDAINGLKAEKGWKWQGIPAGLKQGDIEYNPNRFKPKDVDNDNIICNMVLAMHAESKHINDSLKEIADLIKAQRAAIEKNTNGGKADVAALKANKVLTKKMVTDILAGAVTAGSAAVTIGAMNPRRANDWETYKTMVNITDMEAACKVAKA